MQHIQRRLLIHHHVPQPLDSIALPAHAAQVLVPRAPLRVLLGLVVVLVPFLLQVVGQTPVVVAGGLEDGGAGVGEGGFLGLIGLSDGRQSALTLSQQGPLLRLPSFTLVDGADEGVFLLPPSAMLLPLPHPELRYPLLPVLNLRPRLLRAHLHAGLDQLDAPPQVLTQCILLVERCQRRPVVHLDGLQQPWLVGCRLRFVCGVCGLGRRASGVLGPGGLPGGAAVQYWTSGVGHIGGHGGQNVLEVPTVRVRVRAAVG
mmetsp:Transcript_28881/g.72013  ORF Transcript_28881/g.72013 Transcript_28881/m.72013 type:complete len:259 (-) Transcript_28881:42-818(-)